MKAELKGHIWAASAFAALSLFGTPTVPELAAEPQQRQGQRQNQQNIRFRAMDVNGDGRITRQEWRGNARSFRNHDWDGDGVLAGDEVRLGAVRGDDATDEEGFYNWTAAGFRAVDANGDNRITRTEWRYDPELFIRADRNRDNVLTQPEFLGDESVDIDSEDRFDDLDVNNNGRIERDEWHGTRDAFDWLDRNNDGRLSRAETVGNDAVAGTTGGRPASEVVVVNAQTRWTDTGIDVTSGDRLQVRADGTIVLSHNNNGTDTATPAGSRTGRKAADAPFPQMPAGGLIARVGDSGPFYFGDGGSLGQVPSSGRLFLGVNDDFLRDNSGEFRVTITVRR